MSESNGAGVARKREMIAELKSMQRIEKLLRDLTPTAMIRVGDWTKSIAADMSAEKAFREAGVLDDANERITV